MEAKVTWKGKMSFTGEAGSGFSVPLGTSVESGGSNDGFTPMQLVAVGLAGCTAMDVISILQKKQQDVTAFEVKVTAERVETHPRIFSHMLVEYIITGHNIDPNTANRAVELSTTKYCSVQAMLDKAVPIEHKITNLESV
jgi:putative redox protein